MAEKQGSLFTKAQSEDNVEQAQEGITGAGAVIGTGISVFKDLIGAVRRNPNVKAWAQSKRAERKRLKALGLSGKEFRSAFARWQANNPKPQGSDPYNPLDLGQSAQTDGNAMALDSTSALPSNVATNNAGFKFSPFLLLLALPFVFPKPFAKFRKSLKI